MIYFKKLFNRNVRLIPPKNSVISDLFIWRQNKFWETNFELINFKPFFDKNNKENENIKIEIRDKEGKVLFNNEFVVESMKKKTINFSKIFNASKLNSDYGTFSVYHEHLNVVNEFNSYIAERGYSSYKYKDLNTLSSVHGNLDAISILNDQRKLLGKQTLFNKDFNIQYKFENQNYYDLFFVNPTSKSLKIKLTLIKQNQKYDKILDIKPAGSDVLSLKKNHGVSRIVVKSKYFMSRPLIFEYNENFLNSFHA